MPEVFDSAVGPRVRIGDRHVLYFGGNDYLGLAAHPAVVEAGVRAIEAFGAGAAASPMTSGRLRPHVELEQELAETFGSAVVLLATGYLGANALHEAFVAPGEVVLHDDSLHASGLVGEADRRHMIACGDTDALASLVQRHDGGVFMCSGVTPLGMVPPVDRYAGCLEGSSFRLVVDDAHGVGILGEGRGALSAARAEGFTIGSCAKAFGSSGGFVVLPDANAVRKLRDSSAHVGATSIAPASAAAATAAVRIARCEPERRHRALGHARRIAEGLAEQGFEFEFHGFCVIAIHGRRAVSGREIGERLWNAGILVPHVTYPGTNAAGCLRLAATAAHTDVDVDTLLGKLSVVGE